MKTITLGEYLDALWIVGEERDIEVDSQDSICYSGTRLTEEGKKVFAKALELPMYVEDGRITSCVHSFDNEDYEEGGRLELAWEMLAAMAGYCSVKDYDKWFEH